MASSITPNQVSPKEETTGPQTKIRKRCSKTATSKSTDGDDFYCCDVCGLELKSKGGLFIHKRTKHNPNHFYECHVCDQRFTGKFGMQVHVKNVHEKLTFDCEFCGKKLRSKASLTHHIKSHHLNPAKVACLFCDEIFDHKSLILGHLIEAHATRSETDAFECNFCHENFQTEKSIRRHIKLKHNEGKFKCEHCEKVFDRKSYLHNHTRSVHEKFLQCDKCEMKFGAKHSLQKHVFFLYSGLSGFMSSLLFSGVFPCFFGGAI